MDTIREHFSLYTILYYVKLPVYFTNSRVTQVLTTARPTEQSQATNGILRRVSKEGRKEMVRYLIPDIYINEI